MEPTLDILGKFVDPQTGEPLVNDAVKKVLVARDGAYRITDGVINFYVKTPLSAEAETHSQPLVNGGQERVDAAPELRFAHEIAFEQAAETGGNIYGRMEDLPVIAQSGHFRRMKILSDFDLGDIENKIAVDFGTGPWGFGAIFPKLRMARQCIGFDVSAKALEIARNVDSRSELGSKVVFATSDGEVIPLADCSVDVFFGGEVVEHVRSPRQFLQEIARVCKDRAIVILTTPNRGAIYYRIANIPYCVGPEHIALLSYEEWRDLLDLFTDEIRILGYETSLGPGLDHLRPDPDSCELIQRRAYGVPELASGMIARSVISKKKLAANRRKYRLEEMLHSSASISFRKPADSLKLFGDVSGALLLPDNEVTIPCLAREVTLLFWGHNWSGFVEITFGDVALQRDLYSPDGGFIRVDLESSQGAEFIRIRPLAKKRDASFSDQVIFYKAIQYGTPSCC
jgi:SAM-dependent methyltransferase